MFRKLLALQNHRLDPKTSGTIAEEDQDHDCQLRDFSGFHKRSGSLSRLLRSKPIDLNEVAGGGFGAAASMLSVGCHYEPLGHGVSTLPSLSIYVSLLCVRGMLE